MWNGKRETEEELRARLPNIPKQQWYVEYIIKEMREMKELYDLEIEIIDDIDELLVQFILEIRSLDPEDDWFKLEMIQERLDDLSAEEQVLLGDESGLWTSGVKWN